MMGKVGVSAAGLSAGLSAKVGLLLAATLPVCLAQLPPSESTNYAAKAVTLSGQVSVLRDTESWALLVGDTVKVKELILTGPDGHATFQVSDGSWFEVFPNARVVFRKNPPNWRDLIHLPAGRVRLLHAHRRALPNHVPPAAPPPRIPLPFPPLQL